eukprot:1156073-Pyramimonas_sp.AAC.1
MIQRLSPRPLDGSLSRRCQVAGRSPACCAPAARTTSKYFGRKSNHSPVVEWLVEWAEQGLNGHILPDHKPQLPVLEQYNQKWTHARSSTKRFNTEYAEYSLDVCANERRTALLRRHPI